MDLTLVHNTSITLRALPFSQTKHLFVGHRTAYLPLPRLLISSSVLSLARRRTNSSSSSKKKKTHSGDDFSKDEDLDEDAFEALFKQLEEDLKKDEQLLDEGEDEITEEDLAALEGELEEALAEDEDLKDLLNLTVNDDIGEVGDEEELEEEEEEEEEDDEEEEEEEPVKLKGWQLRQLAYALKVGRRKTNIKNLSAELCLDRAVVLNLLREPPPNLLMMSASLPDKQEEPSNAITVPNSEAAMSSFIPSEIEEKTERKQVKIPIHVQQGSWSEKKRLKKVQVDTLETIYRRTKRPTNAMISSIVQVTNLPRRRVVKWFEDKRDADGLPQQRRPYQRSFSDS